jgi:hypothetical protein
MTLLLEPPLVLFTSISPPSISLFLSVSPPLSLLLSPLLLSFFSLSLPSLKLFLLSILWFLLSLLLLLSFLLSIPLLCSQFPILPFLLLLCVLTLLRSWKQTFLDRNTIEAQFLSMEERDRIISEEITESVDHVSPSSLLPPPSSLLPPPSSPSSLPTLHLTPSAFLHGSPKRKIFPIWERHKRGGKNFRRKT